MSHEPKTFCKKCHQPQRTIYDGILKQNTKLCPNCDIQALECPVCKISLRSDKTIQCPKCNSYWKEQLNPINSEAEGQKISELDYKSMIFICLFTGGFGVHRFYAGKTATAILMLLTFGGCGIWALIDLINIINEKFEDSEGCLIRYK